MDASIDLCLKTPVYDRKFPSILDMCIIPKYDKCPVSRAPRKFVMASSDAILGKC